MLARPETASFIEEGIRPLVVALAWWPGINPFNSCAHRPYVSFHCKARAIILEIKEKAKGTGWGVFRGDISEVLKTGSPKPRGAVYYVGGDPDQGGTLYTFRPYKRKREKASIEELADRLKHSSYDPNMKNRDRLLKAPWSYIYEYYPVDSRGRRLKRR